jgi:integrase/recombinase XerD
MKKIFASRVILNGEQRISLRFPYDDDLIRIVKQIGDVRWSTHLNYWHFPDNGNPIPDLLRLFRGHAFVDISALIRKRPERSSAGKTGEGNDKALKKGFEEDKNPSLSENATRDIEKFRKWLQSGRYPETTVKIYTGMVAVFLKFISPKEATECKSEDLVRMVDEYIIPKGLSHSYQNQMVSAVKKFYEKIHRSVIDPGEISRPRPQHRLPNVLSKDEVKKVLDSVINEKHRVMLCLVYGCGLRRSEVLELKPDDIDRDRKLLGIRQSKGFKDRLVPISDKLIGMVDNYILHYKPFIYLFEGQIRGKKYSPESLEKVFRTAYERAGLKKKDITLHGLRHSYATHLLEAGTDLRYIQALLGHKSSRTTEIYTHVTMHSIEKIRSPFDDL